MRYHVSDKARRVAEAWKDACCLYCLLQIDLERFPKGNVIRKHSLQKRILHDGSERVYSYYYENVDVWGKGQFHLPLKRRGDAKHKLWKLRGDVLYRQTVEARAAYLRKQLERRIKDLNLFRSSKEASGTLEELLRLAGCAIRQRERYAECRERAARRLAGKAGEDVRLLTDLGESVRSKNECLFANKLREMGIPYVYELVLSNEVAPDFTVFIGEAVYYIELLGMMEQEEYRKRLREKLEIYRRMKILPGGRLILVDMTGGADTRRLEELLRRLLDGAVPKGIYPAVAGKAA